MFNDITDSIGKGVILGIIIFIGAIATVAVWFHTM